MGHASVWAQNCQYLAYDAFDYSAGSPLNSLSGGSGWASPWNVQNDDAQLPGFQAIAGSLTFGNLQTLGASASGGRVYLTAGRRLNSQPDGPFGAYVSDNSDAIGSENGDTLWISALLRKEQNNNQAVYLDFHRENLNWCNNCSSQHLAFGYFGTESEVGGQKRWSLRLNNNVYNSATPLVPGQTAFLVLEVIFNAGNTLVNLYVNPATLGAAGPGTPALSQSAGANQLLRSVAFYPGNAAGNGVVDEIRLADSYACAAPDGSVNVDLPPVAIIQTSGASGQAPFQVQFNGSSSYDPENTALEYFWNFGDGSAGATGPVVNHIYNNFTGPMVASLTVRDAGGLEHTAYRTILVLNANNTYSCQPRVSCLAMASCTQNNGHIQVSTGNNSTFSLKNASGNTLAPNGNDYTNLAPGPYTLLVNGAGGCRDTLSLWVRTDSSTCAGWQPDTCALRIGTNLSGFADWVPERPMRNLMKHVRSQPIPFVESCFCWYLPDIVDEMTYLPEGYPTHIPQASTQGPALLRYVISSEGANLPPGQSYVLLYDGTGNIVVQGDVSTTASTGGRVAFQVNGPGNIWLVIRESLQSNPVRNFRLLRAADEQADLEAQPFYSGFLEKIAPFSTLRFMDWGATNNNPVVQWNERSDSSYFTYATPYGVPYEMMVRLANMTQKDVWLCVPHAADISYISQMALFFRDRLDPSLHIYLEYSNEVWNWIFEQSHYNVETSPANLNYGRAYAEKARRVFEIWHQVFGDEKYRIKRVLGIQAGYNSLNENILAQLPAEAWDLGAPTHYVGLDHSATGNPVLHAGSTPEDIINNARNSFYGFKDLVKQDYRNIQVFGKEVVTYEGGQHFVGNVFGVPYDYQQAMWDAQYSQGIYDLYTELHDSISTWGCRMATNFSLASRQASVYGSWGVVNDIDVQPPYAQTAPKYQALLDRICSGPVSATLPEPEAPRWQVAPNPSGGYFRLIAAEGAPVLRQKTIYDALGRVVWQSADSGTDIRVQLAPGLYWLELMDQYRRSQTKLIIRPE
jgi:PKD repeat protein